MHCSIRGSGWVSVQRQEIGERWDLEEEGGREGEAWLAGGGTSWDLRLEEGVVEIFWLFLVEVCS